MFVTGATRFAGLALIPRLQREAGVVGFRINCGELDR